MNKQVSNSGTSGNIHDLSASIISVKGGMRCATTQESTHISWASLKNASALFFDAILL